MRCRQRPRRPVCSSPPSILDEASDSRPPRPLSGSALGSPSNRELLAARSAREGQQPNPRIKEARVRHLRELNKTVRRWSRCGRASASQERRAQRVASAKTAKAARRASTLVVDTSFIINTPTRHVTSIRPVTSSTTPLYDTLLTEHGSSTKPVPDLATSYTASTRRQDVHVPAAPRREVLRRHAGDLGRRRLLAEPRDQHQVRAGLPAGRHQGRAPRGPYTVVLKSSAPNPAIPEIVTTPALGIVNSKAVTGPRRQRRAERVEDRQGRAVPGHHL